LADKIYSNFTKVTKTRTQLNTTIDATSVKARSIEGESNGKESKFRGFLREAEALMVTHPEVTKLREHIEMID
jgi:hypothetical protein